MEDWQQQQQKISKLALPGILCNLSKTACLKLSTANHCPVYSTSNSYLSLQSAHIVQLLFTFDLFMVMVENVGGTCEWFSNAEGEYDVKSI